MPRSLLTLTLGLLLSACYPELIPRPQGEVREGWVPVYVPEAAAREVVRLPVTANAPGGAAAAGASASVVTSGAVTVVLDSLIGIAAYRGGPEERFFTGPESYLRIPGANRLSGRVDSLVVNNLDDLLVLDASDPTRVFGRERVAGGAGAYGFSGDTPSGTALDAGGQRITPRYFVCPDPARGLLLGWRYGRSDALECILTP